MFTDPILALGATLRKHGGRRNARLTPDCARVNTEDRLDQVAKLATLLASAPCAT